MDTMFLSLEMLIALEDLEMQELLMQQQQVFESEQIQLDSQDYENKSQDCNNPHKTHRTRPGDSC